MVLATPANTSTNNLIVHKSMDSSAEEGLALAKAMACSYMKAEKEAYNLPYQNKTSGKTIYSEFKPYINKWLSQDSKLRDYAEKNGVSSEEVFEELGSYLFKNKLNYNRTSDKGAIRGLMGSTEGVAVLLRNILGKKALKDKHKAAIISILQSIQYLCEITGRKEPDSYPSKIFHDIIERKMLWRYLGHGKHALSYHFLSLVPNVEELFNKYATTHIDPTNLSKVKLDPEYQTLLEALPIYLHEAECACKEYKFHMYGSILDVTDNYYASHKNDFAKRG